MAASATRGQGRVGRAERRDRCRCHVGGSGSGGDDGYEEEEREFVIRERYSPVRSSSSGSGSGSGRGVFPPMSRPRPISSSSYDDEDLSGAVAVTAPAAAMSSGVVVVLLVVRRIRTAAKNGTNVRYRNPALLVGSGSGSLGSRPTQGPRGGHHDHRRLCVYPFRGDGSAGRSGGVLPGEGHARARRAIS